MRGTDKENRLVAFGMDSDGFIYGNTRYGTPCVVRTGSFPSRVSEGSGIGGNFIGSGPGRVKEHWGKIEFRFGQHAHLQVRSHLL